MKEIDSVKAEFNKQLKLSKIDLNNITDGQLRLRTEGVVNAAKQKLQALKPKVMQLMMNQSTTIFVYDAMDITEPLKDLEAKNDNVVTIDFMGLEKEVMKVTYPEGKIKGFPFNVTTISRMNNALFELRNILNAEYIPPISISASDYRMLKDKGEVMAMIQKTLFKTFSNSLKTLYIAKQMNDALEKNMSDVESLVFFVVNTNGSLRDMDGMTGKTVFLDASQDTPTTAEQLQKLVSKKLKEQKNKETV